MVVPLGKFPYLNFSTILLFQVRTLFVSGLPMDTKPRELYLLFRAYEVMCASHPSQPVLRINEARITTWIWFSIQWSQKGVRFLKSIQEVDDLIDCKQLDRNLSTNSWQLVIFQGYEGSLLKVTSKNGKTASPVGFVTFASRASAEAAKQDLQVGRCCHTLPPPCHHCRHCLPPLALDRRHGSPGCHGYSPVLLPAGPPSPRCSRQQKAANQQRDHGALGQSEAWKLLLWTLLLLRPNISCHCAFSKLNNLILLKSICKYKHHNTHHHQIWSDLICASSLPSLTIY